ncbi:UV-endonuclease UvdE [Lindgomyces ingoldianus]|uniref:UV-endonuclease UvdE n=1 Tax=Lindgomyces ingoldianus TaxID=673940 RepID=A0ACB6Q9B9_9PLEO|nr:UV-endonuclease UvdE [Lindgomyces ingoldianus]KAF2463496.1 UV-endonuclease UvdE [Lindgomyces ingoldianus]
MRRCVHSLGQSRATQRASSAFLCVQTLPLSVRMAKRKRSTTAAASSVPDIPPARHSEVPLPGNVAMQRPKPLRRQPSQRTRGANPTRINTNANPEFLDGMSALQVSPDSGGGVPLPAMKPRVGNVSSTGPNLDAGAVAPTSTHPDANATTEDIAAPAAGHPEHGPDRQAPGTAVGGSAGNRPNAKDAVHPESETTPVDLPGRQPGRNKRQKGPSKHVKVDNAESNSTVVNDTTTATENAVKEDVGVMVDPEAEEGQPNQNADGEEIKEVLSRPPPVNSDYLPLPWKGRLGFACLNTYLRNANPPIFSSRTCRIASILEHRHPLKDPSRPEHPIKNRPDKNKPADVARGQKYVEELGLANARDIIKMMHWNDKYGIRFMRLSSEIFPFASHGDYGYKLAPFAANSLAEVGRVIAELGHRVTTHPGQFTQLGSPRKQVIDASIRDLDYHDEMLSLLKLPPQQDRDAVMILHLGGAFGDKPATLDRFRENYAKLPQSVKNRLVLENDDVVWSVHDLLPLCQELNIPFVLDFHHHNIVFNAEKIREGTKDIKELIPVIVETWTRKGITPKMHYSEPCPEATASRSRRKHSPRVMTLPPCPDTMDLMIEAKDKEQAVFELMRTFKLPGFDLFNDIIPHVRQDENKPVQAKLMGTAMKRGKRKKKYDYELEALDERLTDVEEENKGEVLIPEEEIAMGGPERRVYWPPGMEDWLRPRKRVIKKKEEGAATQAKKKRKTVAIKETRVNGDVSGVGEVKTPSKKAASEKGGTSAKKKTPKSVPTPSPTDEENGSSPPSDLGDEKRDVPLSKNRTAPPALSRRRCGRGASGVTYKEEDADEVNM